MIHVAGADGAAVTTIDSLKTSEVMLSIGRMHCIRQGERALGRRFTNQQYGYAAAFLPAPPTEATVFRICEAIW